MNASKSSVPHSAYDKVGGMYYFARMLSKIRLHAAGTLREDFHKNLGSGADAWCCDFLRVDYDALKNHVAQGGSDEEVFDWCCAQGRRPNEGDVRIWNSFAAKLGWNDPVTPYLEKYKKQSGLEHRDDIQTMMEYFEFDEGRKS